MSGEGCRSDVSMFIMGIVFHTGILLQCVCYLETNMQHFFLACFSHCCAQTCVSRVHGLESSENWPVHYQLKPEITEVLLWFKVASLRSDFENTVLNSSIF